MKICTSCKSSLPFTEFFKNPNTVDGFGSQCRACDKAGRVLKGRDKKQRLVNELGGCCSKCGYKKSLNALQFHHHADDKEAVVSSLLRRNYEEALAEAKKCVLLCANCHAEEHATDLSSLVYGGKVRTTTIPHGTVAGYKKCKPVCDPCRLAWNAHCAVYRKAKATAQ